MEWCKSVQNMIEMTDNIPHGPVCFSAEHALTTQFSSGQPAL